MVGYKGSNKGTLYVGGDVAPMKGWRFQQGGGETRNRKRVTCKKGMGGGEGYARRKMMMSC